MSRLTRRFFCLAVLAVSISLLAACQKTTPSTPDLPDLKVGAPSAWNSPRGRRICSRDSFLKIACWPRIRAVATLMKNS